jgi:hypothetical protein
MADFQILDEFDELEDSWSWQKLLKPSTMVAIGLHTLVLVVPIAGSQNHVVNKPPQKAPQKQDEQVKLTTLSADAVVGNSEPSASSESSSTPTLIPKPSDEAKPSPSPSPSNSPKASTTPSPSPSASAAKSPEPKISPKSIPTPSPKAKTPDKSPSSSPSPSPKAKTPASSPKATTQTPKPKAPASPTKPVTDIANYPGVTNGTGQLKGMLVTTDSVDKVAAFYLRELKDKGFEAVDESRDSTEKILRINKGTPYLSIIPVDGKTAIARGNQRVDKSKLTSVATMSPEETAFDNYLAKASFKTEDLHATKNNMRGDVASPDSFLDKDNDQLGNVKQIGLLESPLAQAASSISSELSKLSLSPKESGEHGGGKLYEIGKKYLSLVPSKDGKRTYVVIWDSKPG